MLFFSFTPCARRAWLQGFFLLDDLKDIYVTLACYVHSIDPWGPATQPAICNWPIITWTPFTLSKPRGMLREETKRGEKTYAAQKFYRWIFYEKGHSFLMTYIHCSSETHLAHCLQVKSWNLLHQCVVWSFQIIKSHWMKRQMEKAIESMKN
jgi:hypothetical protein